MSMSLAEQIQLISAAHDAIYSPSSSNQTRQEATNKLEQVKTADGSAELGLAITQQNSLPFPIRKFGLSIVLHHVLNLASDDAAIQPVIPVIVDLASSIPANAPHYYISAIATVWSEVAKRSWLSGWTEMDSDLVKVWSTGSSTSQAVVLSVLESLCVEAPQEEDKDLVRACNDVFIGGDRSRLVKLGPGSPGWLVVLCKLVTEGELRKRALAALRAAISCLQLEAVVNARVVGAVFTCVMSADSSEMRIDALDCLVDLFGRADLSLDRLQGSPAELLAQVAGTDGLNVLNGLYGMVKGNLADQDCDTEEITLAVKISDLLLAVGQTMSGSGGNVESVNMTAFLGLVLDVVVSPRLIVSSPSMRLLRIILSWSPVRELMVPEHMRVLLEHCASRLVRFEAATDIKTNPNPLFALLEIDIDTSNDRQAFLDSYRRSCSVAVEQLVNQAPREMVDIMLNLAYQVLAGEKSAGTVLYVGALSTMIESALAGCSFAMSSSTDDSPEQHEAELFLRNRFREFGRELIKLTIEDIEIRKAVVSLLTNIAISDFAGQAEFAAEVALMILNIRLPTPRIIGGASCPTEKDSLHAFETTCSSELGKLAMQYADYFFSYYNDWYGLIDGRFQSGDASRRQIHSFHTFLFSIVLRTTSIPSETKQPKLEEMLQAVTSPWSEIHGGQDGFSRSWFLQLLRLDQVLGYIDQKGFANINDWAGAELDAEGRALQEAINERVQELPLRATRYLLVASTDDLEEKKELFALSQGLWANAMDGILTRLLPLLRQAQAFCNLDSWDVSPQTKLVLKRILTDRFWQSGISTESRDDFFARVNSSKTSYEGLASAVRGAVRSVREFAYWILYCFARLDAPFYTQPEPLALALYSDAGSLSCHHLLTLLSLSRHLLMACPPDKRASFLPTMVGHLGTQLEAKIRSEWAAADARLSSGSGDLAEEMKTESVLRRLSVSSVSVASELIRIDSPAYLYGSKNTNGIAVVVLENINQTSSLFLLFVLCLGVRDSQTVNSSCDALQRICRVMYSVVTKTPLQPRTQTPPMTNETIAELKPLFFNQILQRALQSYQHTNFVESQKFLLRLIVEIFKLAAVGPELNQIVVPTLAQLPHMQGDNVTKLQSRVSQMAEIVVNPPSGMPVMFSVTKKLSEMMNELLRPVRGVRVAEWGKIDRVKVQSRPLVRVVKEEKPANNGNGDADPDETLATMQELFN